MLIVTLLAGALMVDGSLSATDGALLLSVLVLFLVLLARRGDTETSQTTEPPTLPVAKSMGGIYGGFSALSAGPRGRSYLGQLTSQRRWASPSWLSD